MRNGGIIFGQWQGKQIEVSLTTGEKLSGYVERADNDTLVLGFGPSVKSTPHLISVDYIVRARELAVD